MNPQVLQALRSAKPPLCVFSTVNDYDQPQSAVLAYVIRDDATVLLSTHSNTRKWANLKKNPKASIVFGVNFGVIGAQYEGSATLVDSGSEYENLKKEYFTTHPELEQYRSNDTAFIVMMPTWIRILDYTVSPPKTEEVKL